MTNIPTQDECIKDAIHLNSEILENDLFDHQVKVEVYLKNGDRKSFEYHQCLPYKMTLGEIERFSAKCAKETFDQMCWETIILSWIKQYIVEPSGNVKKFETLPNLHLNKYQVTTVFI
jgi:hypothetical protein